MGTYHECPVCVRCQRNIVSEDSLVHCWRMEEVVTYIVPVYLVESVPPKMSSPPLPPLGFLFNHTENMFAANNFWNIKKI